MKLPFMLLLCLFVATPFFATAQLSDAPQALNLILTPPHPRAQSFVTIEAENFSADMNGAEFVWSVNGIAMKKGIGAKELSTRTGPEGSATTVSVTATTPDGRVFTALITLRPASVDLLWQTESYTPPFYKAKSLFPYQGTALIVALPRFVKDDGKRVPARELIYTWKEDGTVIGEGSGYGKNMFLVQGTVPIRTKTVSVEVATPDGLFSASASITLDPVEPRVVFYEDHPRYGLRLHTALAKNYSLQGEEAKILASPYYVESRGSQKITYNWKQNGKVLVENGPSVVLRRVSGKGGVARLTLGIENADRPFQAAEGEIAVSFPSLLTFIDSSPMGE